MEKVIDKILKDFDFKQIYDVMKLTDWHWSGVGIPTVEMLKNKAQDLLITASVLTIGQSASTGGFVATRLEENEIELSFVLTQTSASD